MTRQTEQVIKFYETIWNQYDKEAIPQVIASDFVFRGSLGLEKTGRSGFIEYLDMVHEALAHYQCTIKEIVSEGSKVFARMEFSGVHQGEFLGYPATGNCIAWEGAALFSFCGELISDLWVLGDVRGLEDQLRHGKA